MAEKQETEGPPQQETLLVFANPDKTRHRSSGHGEHMPGWPFRLLLAGPPGVGKRNLALNLMFRLEPPPSAVHIVHYDPETQEYDELETLGVPIFYYSADDLPTIENLESPDPPPMGNSEDPIEPPEESESSETEPEEGGYSYLGELDMLADPPTPPEPAIDPKEVAAAMGESPLVIFDEITRDILSPVQAARMERLLNYGSTHKNSSVITSIQDITSIPPKSRRAFDHFALWKQPDEGAVTLAANRVGVPPDLLRELFGLCLDRHDSIWVDTHRSPEDPYRFRLNWLTPIRAAEKVDFE